MPTCCLTMRSLEIEKPMTGHEEKVLVVERKVVEQAGMFQGLTFEVERYLSRLLAPGVPRFMVRSEAETNPDFKQLIPYVIMSFLISGLIFRSEEQTSGIQSQLHKV